MRAVMLYIVLLSAASAHAQEPVVRQIVAPVYPRLAWLASLQGRVLLELEIDKNGRVQSVKASGSHPLLRDESEKNIRQWTFQSFRDPSSFPVRLKVQYVYRFEGESEDELSPPRVVITVPDKVEIVARPPGHICVLYGDKARDSQPRSERDLQTHP